jgi:general secretion pathway protein J
MRRDGFTLIELLVALFIFALIASAGVSLLSVSVRSQALVKTSIDEGAALGRLTSLLGQDLAQARSRPWRDLVGGRHAAFSGGKGDDPLLLSFLRASPEGREGGSQRIEVRLAGPILQRESFEPADGTAEGRRVQLMQGVSRAQLRYRKKGKWFEVWRPTNLADLPDAVELTLNRPRRETRFVFLVGAGGR